MDAIPIFSQTKSIVQYACGQGEQAHQTQVNFFRQCPVVSQVTSTVQLARGNKKAAIDTQKECGGFLFRCLNGIPVIGHVKAGIHYAVGDTEGGSDAVKAATHNTNVIAGGIGGFMLGGPVGACVAASAAGAATDAAITGIDSSISGKSKPYGIMEPLADPRNAGKWCDAVGCVILDGVAGRASRAAAKSFRSRTSKGAAKSSTALLGAAEKSVIARALIPSAIPLGGLLSQLQDPIIKKVSDSVHIYAKKAHIKIKQYVLAQIKQHLSSTEGIVKLYSNVSNFLSQVNSENAIKPSQPRRSSSASDESSFARPATVQDCPPPVTVMVAYEDGKLRLLPFNILMCIENDNLYIVNEDGVNVELRHGSYYTVSSNNEVCCVKQDNYLGNCVGNSFPSSTSDVEDNSPVASLSARERSVSVSSDYEDALELFFDEEAFGVADSAGSEELPLYNVVREGNEKAVNRH